MEKCKYEWTNVLNNETHPTHICILTIKHENLLANPRLTHFHLCNCFCTTN